MENELSFEIDKELDMLFSHPQDGEEWLENAIMDGTVKPPADGCGVTFTRVITDLISGFMGRSA